MKKSKKKSSFVARFLTLSLLFIYMTFLPQTIPGSEKNEYMFKAWMIEDGLPQNSILSITQTRDGYLWFGTELGLVRFNGTSFRVFNSWNTPALKNNKITSLGEDNNGSLWIGTDGGGISRLKNGLWENLETKIDVSGRHITIIYKIGKKGLLLGTKKGLLLVKDNKFSPLKGKKGLENQTITSIIMDQKGQLWVGTKKGLFLSKNSNLSPSLSFRQFLSNPVTCLFSDTKDIIWVGTEKGLININGNKLKTYTINHGLSSNWITTIYQDKRNNLWLGTYGEGISSLKKGTFTHYSILNGLSDDFIHNITEDCEGNLWIGTYAGGIIRMSPKIISSISRENGLPENTVNSVLMDPEGFLWVGTRHRGLCKFKDATLIKTYTTENGLTSNRIRSLFRSAKGELWIGTEGGGLNCLSGHKITTYSQKDGLASNNINAIFQTHTGALWIGGDKGLDRIEDRIFIKDTKTETFKNYSIRTIFEDQNHNLWIGSTKGLSKITEKMIQHMQINNKKFEYDVLSIYESPRNPGILWIGTNGNGLLRYKNGLFTQYSEEDGLHSNYIFSINETGIPLPSNSRLKKNKSYLWMSSYRGIFRVSLEVLNSYSENKNTLMTSTFFNEEEGMISSECIGFNQPSAWKTEKDQLYIPTMKGVAMLNTRKIAVKKTPPPVKIEDIIIDNESFINRENAKISAGKQMFEFYFTALSFTAPKKIRYRYKLEGFEKKWVTLDSNQKKAAIYLNLKPGKYIFRVIARNNYGNWNQEGASFPFQICSDFEKNLLVYIPPILVLLLFGVGFYVWQQKKSKSAKKVKKYQTSALNSDRGEQILQKLLTIMEEEEIYLDPDLSLKKLSEKIMVHPNHVSQIVNDNLNQSFNDFINSYRIKVAQKKLMDPQEMDKTILEIAYDVGFYSKSVFNTAFKKFTGMTPSHFRKKSLKA